MIKITVFLLFSFPLLIAATAEVKQNPSAISIEVFVKAVDSYNDKDLSSSEKEKVVRSVLTLLREKSDFSYQHYWKSVFQTFECELKDKGKILPTCIISELSQIKSSLKKAYREYPSYYFCAPARTLGIMYFKMPAIAGGSNKKAFRYISEAYQCAPGFSDNQEWFQTIKKEID